MGFSMMLVFMKVVYTRGNIAMVLIRPGQYKTWASIIIYPGVHYPGVH